MVPRLAAMASGHASPQARLHALNALEGLAALEAAQLKAVTGGCPPRGTRPCRAAIGGVSRTGRTAGPHGGRPLASGTLPVGPESGGVLGSDGGPGAGQAGPGPLRRPLVSDRRAELGGGVLRRHAGKACWPLRPGWLGRQSETVPFFAELASVISARNRSSEIEALLARVCEGPTLQERRVADGCRRGPDPRTGDGRSSPQGNSRRPRGSPGG